MFVLPLPIVGAQRLQLVLPPYDVTAVTTRARVEQVSIRGRRGDAILRLNPLHLIQEMNSRPAFHFHLMQRSLMELHEHALCIPF